MPIIKPNRRDAYQLLHDGTLALARIEANGMLVDEPYLRTTIEQLRERSRDLKLRLQRDPIWTEWRKRFGDRASLTARPQLGEILYKRLGYTPKEFTETTRDLAEEDRVGATDESALEKINLPFLRDYLRMQKYEKASGTYLKGLLRESIDGVIHPDFDLGNVVTYRGACRAPNLQNIPVRDEEIQKLVRMAFPCPEGGVIVERDFKGIEVVVAACYHQDPAMETYITDPTKDMHRDMAMQIYKLPQKAVNKAIRHAAKNQFVFPQFYGSFYAQCAPALWDSIERRKFTLPDGTPLKDHLRAKGISKLGACDPGRDPIEGTFEAHIKAVEQDFWYRRFPVYSEWKKRWWTEYQRKGYFNTLTGFQIRGALSRTQCINYPVQGSAFHCLLWSLIHVQRELQRRRMRTKLILQIHDSLLAAVPFDEVEEYHEIVDEVATRRIKQHFPWISLPLVVETEICPPGGTWFHKQEIARGDNGEGWRHKDAVFAKVTGLLRHLESSISSP